MKVQLISNAVHLTSSISMDAFKMMKRANPEALKLKDEKGNTVFAIDYREDVNAGSISNHGIVFNAVDNGGKLALTRLFAADVKADMRMKAVEQDFMFPAAKLLELEASFAQAKTGYEESAAEFMSQVEVL